MMPNTFQSLPYAGRACDLDACRQPLRAGQEAVFHHRLGAVYHAVHHGAGLRTMVKGEDVTGHTVTVGVLTEPDPSESPAWDPDVADALEAIGETVGQAVGPLAQALQETRQALVRMTPVFQDLHDTLEAVLDVTQRAGLSPSWVQDREILDHARDLIARTAPNGAPDADTPSPDPAG